MGMMETFGIGKPAVIKGGDKIHLAYSIPLPAGHDQKLAIERMTASIARMNYGFEAEIRPGPNHADERLSTRAVHLFALVPESDRHDPMRLHALSYGMAIRARRELEAP